MLVTGGCEYAVDVDLRTAPVSAPLLGKGSGGASPCWSGVLKAKGIDEARAILGASECELRMPEGLEQWIFVRPHGDPLSCVLSFDGHGLPSLPR